MLSSYYRNICVSDMSIILSVFIDLKLGLSQKETEVDREYISKVHSTTCNDFSMYLFL
jgi:hypothetical protein